MLENRQKDESWTLLSDSDQIIKELFQIITTVTGFYESIEVRVDTETFQKVLLPYFSQEEGPLTFLFRYTVI